LPAVFQCDNNALGIFNHVIVGEYVATRCIDNHTGAGGLFALLLLLLGHAEEAAKKTDRETMDCFPSARA
jgi:hypothetical protein